MKKASHEQPPTNADFQPNGDEELESENASIINVPILSQELISNDDVDTSIEHTSAKQLKKTSHEQPPTNADFQPNGDEELESKNVSIINVPILSQELISNDDVDTSIALEHTSAKQLKKASHEQPPTNEDFQPKGDEESESENASIINVPILSQELKSNDDVDTSIALEHTNAKELSSPTITNEEKSLVWSFTKTCTTKSIICVWTIPLYFFFFLSIFHVIYPVGGILTGKLRKLIGDKWRVNAVVYGQ